MTSGVRFLASMGRCPFENAEIFAKKKKEFKATRPQLNKYARLCGFLAFKSPRMTILHIYAAQ